MSLFPRCSIGFLETAVPRPLDTFAASVRWWGERGGFPPTPQPNAQPNPASFTARPHTQVGMRGTRPASGRKNSSVREEGSAHLSVPDVVMYVTYSNFFCPVCLLPVCVLRPQMSERCNLATAEFEISIPGPPYRGGEIYFSLFLPPCWW